MPSVYWVALARPGTIWLYRCHETWSGWRRGRCRGRGGRCLARYGLGGVVLGAAADRRRVDERGRREPDRLPAVAVPAVGRRRRRRLQYPLRDPDRRGDRQADGGRRVQADGRPL